METQTQRPPWGYLVRLDEAAPIIELRGRFVPVSFHEELAFKIDHNEIAETTLWVASFPCWVSTTKVMGKKMKIKYNSVITVKMEKKFKVLFVKRSINEVFLQDAKLREDYIIDKLLGEGGFGQVYTVYKKASGERQALKIQYWTESGARYLTREADILLQLKHPCIIQTHDIKYSKSHMFIIMEYMNGGDLSRYVNFQGCHLSVQETKLIFYQIVKAVYYLHLNGVCHRDLKPANILLCHPTPHTLIKVSDLGLAKSEIMHGPMYSQCGTEEFLAPEVLRGGRIYDKKVDVWSMGVILYLSFSGTLPMFSGDTLQFTGDASLLENTSVTDLLQGMLCKQPLMRFDICMVNQHPWLKDNTVEKKVQYLMRYLGNYNVNIRNQTTKVHKSQNDKKSMAATIIVNNGNNFSKLKTAVNKSQSHLILEETGQNTSNKSEVIGEEQNTRALPLKMKKSVHKNKEKKADYPETVKNDQNVNPITKKILVSTYESQNKNVTMKAELSEKSNATPDVPIKSLVERKPETKQQYTNTGHNCKTNNDSIIFKEITYSTNHGLKPQSYSYEQSHYNLDSSYKKAYISSYASSNQNATLKADVPKKINPSDVPTRLYVGKKAEDIFHPEVLNCNKYFNKLNSYNTISDNKKNLAPTYRTSISNPMSTVKVSKATGSYESTTRYVKRPTIKENNWNMYVYPVLEENNEYGYGNDYTIEDKYFRYKFVNYKNDYNSINQNYKDNSEEGFLSSVFGYVRFLGKLFIIGSIGYGIFLFFSNKK